MKNTEKFEVGQTIEIMCSVCETEKDHTVETVTKQGQITKSICQTCETASTFSRGVKTSVAMTKGKTASPYDRTRKYRKGQSMRTILSGRASTGYRTAEIAFLGDRQEFDSLAE